MFGPLSPEWENRRKYAIYKAGIILKCFKSGEAPPRGNPFETEEEKQEREERKRQKEEMQNPTQSPGFNQESQPVDMMANLRLEEQINQVI